MPITYKPEIGSLSEVPNGSWQSLVDQSAGVTPDVELIVGFDSTDFERGMRLASGNRFYVDNSGLYNVQYALQFHNSGGGGSSAHTHVWFKVNGNNVAETGIRQSVTTNSEYQVTSRDYFLTLVAGDYLQLAWSTNHTNISLWHEAATGVVPIVASAVLTMQQVG
jgi:hypothetical protein